MREHHTIPLKCTLPQPAIVNNEPVYKEKQHSFDNLVIDKADCPHDVILRKLTHWRRCVGFLGDYQGQSFHVKSSFYVMFYVVANQLYKVFYLRTSSVD